MAYDAHTGINVGSTTSIDQYAGFGTAFLNPDRFRLEMGDRIHMLGAGSSPFLSWLQMVRTQPTGQYTYSWIESELFTQRDLKCRLRRSAEKTGSGADYCYILQLDTGADWQAFMAAAKADAWTATEGDFMPLIFLTVIKPADPTKKFSAYIRPNAIKLGQTTRDIIFDDGTSDIAFSGVLNGITLYDDGASSDLVGGVSDDLTEITATGTGLTTDFATFGDAGVFDSTFFGVAAGAAGSGEVWVSVSTPNDFLKGYVQGSGLPHESRKRTTTHRNFTQIFKTPYSMAGTMMAVGENGMLIGGEEMRRIRYNKGIEHKIDIETAIMFQGGGTEGTDWGEIPGGSGGLTYGGNVSTSENPLTRFKGLGVGLAVNGLTAKPGFIATKNADLDTRYVFASATADMQELNRLMMLVFDDIVDNPSASKTLFCSQKWLARLAQLGLTANTSGSGATAGTGMFTFGQRVAAPGSLGIIVKEIVTPVGRLDCVHLPRLRGKYEDYAMVIDWANMEYRPLRGRDTMLKANVATEEIDGQVDYYQTESGFECRHESTHAVLKLDS
jgi:hypothetical protein